MSEIFERSEAAFTIFLALLSSGSSDAHSYGKLAESAFIAADRFQEVKEEQDKDDT